MRFYKVSAYVFLSLTLLFISMPVWADAVQVDSLGILNELRSQNELLQQRSEVQRGRVSVSLRWKMADG